MQEEPKPTPKPKKKKISKRLLLVVLLSMVILGLIGVVIASFIDQNESDEIKQSTDCTQITKDIQVLYLQRKNDEAAQKLSDNLSTCTNLKPESQDKNLSAESKIDAVEYYHSLAVISFSKGDKDKAKEYSGKGLEISKGLSSIEQARINDANKVIIDMSRIKDGSYYEIR